MVKYNSSFSLSIWKFFGWETMHKNRFNFYIPQIYFILWFFSPQLYFKKSSRGLNLILRAKRSRMKYTYCKRMAWLYLIFRKFTWCQSRECTRWWKLNKVTSLFGGYFNIPGKENNKKNLGQNRNRWQEKRIWIPKKIIKWGKGLFIKWNYLALEMELEAL